MRRRKKRWSVLEAQLRGYRLATAEITYRMPDHPAILQTFVWQHYDTAPQYPRLRRFLAYWKEHLDGELHSVKVARAELIKPNEFRYAKALYLH